MDLSAYIHLITCWAMIGVIWIIQLVHYPAYRFIDESKFIQYQKFHSRQITYFVAPVMILEMMTTGWLMYFIFQTKNNLTLFLLSTLFLLIVWGVTFFKMVPLHNVLMSGKNEVIIEKIIKLNWWRTLLWTLRGLLLLQLILKY